MMPDWKQLKQLIDQHQRFVLSCHVRPDADALGSELAMADLLRALGKDVRIINPSAAPSTLDFLALNSGVDVLGDGASVNDALAADAHIILDTSAWGQLQGIGDVLRKTHAQVIVVDHHLSSDALGGIEFKDTTAEATGSMIYRFARETGLPLSQRAAFVLFCAIATDTGWFRFPSVSSRTYREIAELIDLGVEPHLVYRQLYECYPLSRYHLSGRILERISLTGNGRVAYTWAERKDFRETAARPVDTEDLVNECLRITGIDAAFIAVEQDNGLIKLSFRSRNGVNVAAIAEQFGGGGHKLAAGATMQGPLMSVVERVRTSLIDAIESQPPQTALPPT